MTEAALKKRGIILSPDLSYLSGKGDDRIYLRTAALYWDFIDCPESALGFPWLRQCDEDQALLEQEGILTRTRGQFLKDQRLSWDAESPREFWAAALSYTLIKHQGDNSLWALSKPSPQFLLSEEVDRFWFIETGGDHKSRPGHMLVLEPQPLASSANRGFTRGKALEIELIGALPVPPAETPIEEVLEFKGSREPELLGLRNTLDELYLNAIQSPDFSRASEHAIGKLDKALIDVNRAANESFVSRLRANTTVSLDLSAAMVGAIIGHGAEVLLGLPGLTTLISTVALGVKARVNHEALKPRLPQELKDYAYVFDFFGEFDG